MIMRLFTGVFERSETSLEVSGRGNGGDGEIRTHDTFYNV